ncbi:hypothetical protein HN011_008858 [Eciton burchellii]|nr:hypothetical protein HN011_008858 [Eciton burchellii]
MTICIETQHFNLNKILLLTVGLWPYHRTKFVQCHVFLFTAILISFIIVQFTTFITTECTTDIVIKILCFASFYMIFLVIHNSVYINTDTVIYMLEKLKYICNELKNEDEIAIIKKYGNDSKRLTFVFSLYCMTNLSLFILLPIFPKILGSFILNASETNLMMHDVMREYFVDQERYSYLILLHLDTTMCIAAISIIATGTLFISLVKHICGIFKIASYRVDQAMVIRFYNSGLPNELKIHKKLANAIDIHCEGMELCDILKSNFVGSFFSLILILIICLSLNLFGLLQSIKFGSPLLELLAHLTHVTVVLLIMFLCNFFGQEVTDHYNHIFLSVYNVEWYVVPIYIQKIILFLLQKGTKEYHIVVGGLFVASMETMVTLMSTSLSYFTVVYSTWEN